MIFNHSTLDNIGQLIREDNEAFGESYVYTYDTAGNMTSKTVYSYTTADTITSTAIETISYTYSGDRLSTYNGTSITYDELGNPLSYYNGSSYTFTWDGRRLATATKGGVSYSFVYNSDGLRTEKTVNGVKHTYYYSGDQLIAEEWNGNVIIFLYDANGSPIGMKYRNSSYAEDSFDSYWYEKNLQGDIVAVYNNDGTKLVSYKYDAWGNHTTTYTNGGAGITAIANNPIRYRSYYYDSDLGLYYLQTRYYDPVVCRFINADSYISTGTGLLGYNMYAYCNNNPITYVDCLGEEPISVAVVTGLGLVMIGLLCLLYDATHDQLLVKAVDSVVEDTKEAVENLSSNTDTRSYTVYGLIDSTTNKIEYVGRTVDVVKRAIAHKASWHRKHLNMVIIKDGLTKEEARGLEQYYMLHYHTINATNKVNNQINGISLKNPKKQTYIDATVNYLGNFVENEFLNWIGR